MPERAIKLMPPLGETKKKAQWPNLPQRPTRLLPNPEPIEVTAPIPDDPPIMFHWRRIKHRVTWAEGPERIAPEWWRQPSSARLRDYYRVEDSSGRRFWIYREGVIGDGRGGAPNWFIHGLFG